MAGLFQDQQIPVTHAKAVFRKLYKAEPLGRKNGEPIWHNYQAISSKVDAFLKRTCCSNEPEIGELQISSYDGSVKFEIRLSANESVESVLIPEKNRLTLCLSSQLGCQRACSFCQTGRMGLKRNLASHEIVQQLLLVNRWIEESAEIWKNTFPGHLNWEHSYRVSNIVFMGMGEPLDNVANLIESIKIFNDPYAFDIPFRKISVSTSGHLDGMREIITAFPKVNLALSLHAAEDGMRNKIMPINKQWPLKNLKEFLLPYYAKGIPGNPFLLVQYIMIKNTNCRESDAEKLVEYLNGLSAKVNLIPFNPFPGSQFSSPDFNEIKKFRDVLHRNSVRSMVRYSKGQDISAACGQLITNAKKNDLKAT